MSFLHKLAAFAKGTMSLFLLLTGASVAPVALADSARILDLSKDFPVGNVNNPDAKYIESLLTQDVRRFLVLEDGEILMDYQRDDVRDEDVYNIWSCTKAAFSVIMGTILTSDEYDLSMEDTLGEILAEERYWSQIIDQEELEFKQNVTIYELMTMTSGLESIIDLNLFQANPFEVFSVANSAGKNIKESLSATGWNATLKGKFNYMPTSNILSYVVKEVTGMTPLEYISVDVLPSLGIKPDEIEWDKNVGGVETSYSNLKMNAKQMAKFAQLYLQKGKSAPDKQLVPESFVEDSLTPILPFDLMPGADYGYFWIALYPGDFEGYLWCGWGIFGQFFCLNYETNRVVVLQRSETLNEDFAGYDLLTTVIYSSASSNFTFASDPTTIAPTKAPIEPPAEAQTSAAFPLSVPGAFPCQAPWQPSHCLSSRFGSINCKNVATKVAVACQKSCLVQV